MRKILLIGHGGREHALLRKLHDDAPDATFFITRGNGGTADLATALPLDARDGPALATWSANNGITLAVVGPEGPLVEGITEQFTRQGVPVFAPDSGAAAIEASKSYAKSLMARAGVPTAAFASFTEIAEAETYIRERGRPLVVKASGLAAGKGAIVCDDEEEAVEAARAMLRDHAFGGAGAEIVVEERLAGEELSYFCLTDGTDAAMMIAAQDHKRIGEGDSGPNTGGMGAYAPVLLDTPALRAQVMRDIIGPTLAALREDDRTFRGLLYAGIMLTDQGPSVIEFNARFGDPETQAVLPLLRSSLLEPLQAIASGGSIAGLSLDWAPAAALTTVLAAGGYPGPVRKGEAITIPAEVARDPSIHVYHAGTRIHDGALVTDGGRVLAVTAVAPTLADAAQRSRAAAAAITFEGKQYRRDIGWRELERHARAS
jgi:phosphoribosylamine--glycine ligase